MKKVTNLLIKLINIASCSGKEKQIQAFIFDWLNKAGLKPVWQKENVMVKIKGQDSSQALIFNAHVDTVKPGDLSQWQTNPFKAVEKRGKVYGLGASDEKAGVTALLLLAKKLKEQKPAVDVWLMFVVKEEVDGSGTKNALVSFKTNDYQQIATVLVEPTGLKMMEIGHKGNVFVKLTVKGDSGHGSEPEKIKDNSVLRMCQVIREIGGLEVEWQKKFKDPILGQPTIGVTAIKGGSLSVPNKFADQCLVALDIRTIPQMHDQVLALLKKSLKKYLIQIEYLYHPAPYGLTQKKSQIVKKLLELKPGLKIKVSKGSTDQCWFTQKQIPAIIFGPGEKNQAHQPNEFCYTAKIEKVVQIYLDLIKKWGTI